MNKETRVIWQTCIKLGFECNETDAHDIFLALKNCRIKEVPEENFYELVEKMRKWQGMYFSTRSKHALVESKLNEQKVDKIIRERHQPKINFDG